MIQGNANKPTRTHFWDELFMAQKETEKRSYVETYEVKTNQMALELIRPM